MPVCSIISHTGIQEITRPEGEPKPSMMSSNGPPETASMPPRGPIETLFFTFSIPNKRKKNDALHQRDSEYGACFEVMTYTDHPINGALTGAAIRVGSLPY